MKFRNDNHSPGSVIRELALTREVNLATQSSASSVDEIKESGRAFQSLIVWGKKLPLYLMTKGKVFLIDFVYRKQDTFGHPICQVSSRIKQ